MGLHVFPILNPIPTSLPIPHFEIVTEPLFEFPESYGKFPLPIYFTYGIVSFHVTLSIQLPLSLSPPSSPRPTFMGLFSMSVSPERIYLKG